MNTIGYKFVSKVTWTSVLIVDIILNDGRGTFSLEEYRLLQDISGKVHGRFWPNATKRAKELLGKQAYCLSLRHRTYVWEDLNWRFYTSVRGAAFEVRVGITREQAFKAFNDFWEAYGLVV